MYRTFGWILSGNRGFRAACRPSSLRHRFVPIAGGPMSQVNLADRPLRKEARPATARLSEEASMRTTLASVPKVALAALTLRGTPAMAQEHAGTQSDQIYGGELSGDDLTNTQ